MPTSSQVGSEPDSPGCDAAPQSNGRSDALSIRSSGRATLQVRRRAFQDALSMRTALSRSAERRETRDGAARRKYQELTTHAERKCMSSLDDGVNFCRLMVRRSLVHHAVARKMVPPRARTRLAGSSWFATPRTLRRTTSFTLRCETRALASAKATSAGSSSSSPRWGTRGGCANNQRCWFQPSLPGSHRKHTRFSSLPATIRHWAHEFESSMTHSTQDPPATQPLATAGTPRTRACRKLHKTARCQVLTTPPDKSRPWQTGGLFADANTRRLRAGARHLQAAGGGHGRTHVGHLRRQGPGLRLPLLHPLPKAAGGGCPSRVGGDAQPAAAHLGAAQPLGC